MNYQGFYINLPLGVIVGLPLVLLHIPDQVPKQSVWKVLPRIHHHLDLLGFALFAPAVIQLLLALQYGGNEYPWRSSVVIGLFCGSGATFIVWMFWNWHKGDDALLPVSMLKRRIIWSSSINYSCLMTTLFGASYFLPIYFQAVKGVSAVLSGVYLLPTIIPQLVTTLASGKLGKCIDDKPSQKPECTLTSGYSYQSGLYTSVCALCRGTCCYWKRALLSFPARHDHWSVDRVPDSHWRWSWRWISNGKCYTALNTTHAFTYLPR